MPKKTEPKGPVEMPLPGKIPEIPAADIPEVTELPEELPEIIPGEDPFETPPLEMPDTDEGD